MTIEDALKSEDLDVRLTCRETGGRLFWDPMLKEWAVWRQRRGCVNKCLLEIEELSEALGVLLREKED